MSTSLSLTARILIGVAIVVVVAVGITCLVLFLPQSTDTPSTTTNEKIVAAVKREDVQDEREFNETQPDLMEPSQQTTKLEYPGPMTHIVPQSPARFLSKMEVAPVTVVIPCIPPHIPRLAVGFDSIEKQERKPTQVIVALSQSLDPQPIYQLAQKHMPSVPLKVTCKEGKAYQAENRNRAVRLVQTEYVAYLDADDSMHPQRISTAYEYLHLFQLDVLYHGFYVKQLPLPHSCVIMSKSELQKESEGHLGLETYHPQCKYQLHHAHAFVRTVVAQKYPQSQAEKDYRQEDSVWGHMIIHTPNVSVAFVDLPLTLYVSSESEHTTTIPVRAMRPPKATDFPFWVFWHDMRDMSRTRLTSLVSMCEQVPQRPIIVTRDNWRQFEHPDMPIHPMFTFLSSNHQSDFLRFYLTYHYGGLWHDVKPRNNFATQADLDTFYRQEHLWLMGVREEDPIQIAPTEMKPFFKDIVSQGAFLAKPRSPLLRDVLDEQYRKLDARAATLETNPPHQARCCKPHDNPNRYPLAWADMGGNIFQPLAYQYRQHLSYKLPRWSDQIMYESGLH